MPSSKRTMAATLITAAVISGTTLATATTASAADYRCKTSSASVDNPAYSGPWADNYNFDVKLCAKRAGGYIYAYAKVNFEGPVSYVNQTDVLDAARFHLQIKKSVSGPDPVVKWANYTGLEYKLEHGNTAGNGSYTTGTIKYKAGSGRYLADGFIQLDWNNDGKGYRNTYFSASPTV
ncbi:hypothetical protein SZN_00345 [Streptomyces zinciresistens K42]|uniref:Secreted protein n=1 Tax=Streptomyces zinciresistens K42 TaxID=700597 RepID=G2G3L8_9ACTN|nr:hypothetical protein [Streptomyces zinciresistens]EGX61764.1 hypothetical protein SZN_00345 [Streptomyces zinciresistens K42]